ncbi:MAG: DUF58 domain-containing protein [Flavobacteriales bacterium]|nr:DUF58 domain-containing protein [Flavobacteriales bacterium]
MITVALVGVSVFLLFTDIFLLFKKTRYIEIVRKVPPILSLSDDNKVKIKVINNSNLNLKLKVIDELPYQLEQRDFMLVISLDKGLNESIEYNLRPTIRGEYFFGNLQVFVKTTIGLAAKKETTKAKTAVAVYPSILQMRQQELIALNHVSFTQGDNKTRKYGKSYEFDQIKSYVPGDDPRNINWKASSRTQQLMVNHFEDERSQQIYSIIDKGRTMKMPFNDLTLVDYAINSTLAFSNIVLKKQDKAGVISFSKDVETTLKAERSSRQLKKILHSLYKEKYSYTEANYEMLYINIRRTVPNRSLIFLYTNFDTVYALERVLPILRMMNRLHLLIVVFFENTELDSYSREESKSVLDIYQHTMARKFILEKDQIIKEMQKHGIQAIKTDPQQLSATAINKYLELKSKGVI